MVHVKTVNHSVFVARAREILAEPEVRAFLVRAKQADPRADHYCYAYRVGEGSAAAAHCSDGGEPSGSAGRPILHAILAAELTNAVVIVARYFGGRKLGIPGLIAAYGGAAAEVLVKAGAAVRTPSVVLEFALSYGQLEVLRRAARRCAAEEVQASYGSNVLLRLKVPLDEAENLARALAPLGLRGREV